MTPEQIKQEDTKRYLEGSASYYAFIYGAELINHWDVLKGLTYFKTINGINVAPKDMEDWNGLVRTYRAFPEVWDNTDSNRIYVFNNQRKNYEDVKPLLEGINAEVLGRKWDKTFNTPDNEYFVRLPTLF